MVKIDRRVARTKRLLATALVELVQDNRYDDISIRDITEHADIGYATFFRHYESKDDLMLEIFNQIISELESLPEQHGDTYFEQEGISFFQHIQDNARLYRSILDSLPFARKLRDNLVVQIRCHLESHRDAVPESSIPYEIVAQHIVVSLLGLIDWWLSNNQAYSIEEMATFYERLIIRASWQAMIPENPMHLPWQATGE